MSEPPPCYLLPPESPPLISSPPPRELRGTLTPLLDKVISEAIEMGEKKALEAALEAERSVAEAAALEAEEAKQNLLSQVRTDGWTERTDGQTDGLRQMDPLSFSRC